MDSSGKSVHETISKLSISSQNQSQKDHGSSSLESQYAESNKNSNLEKTLKKFHLIDFEFKVTLGTGTFGRVYLVKRQSSKDEYYAMKILKKSEIIRLKQVEHIISEKKILSEIHHPFIVNLLDWFQNDSNLFMLLEYVPGGELFSHLRRARRFPVNVAKFYASQIVLALEYLHTKDIIYRDLKPENLLLDANGNIKIADFGFAKRIEDRTWTLCGTPEYLAPEIIQSKGHGKPADWWALGILIYEMLAGFPPYFDDNPYGIYEKILKGRLKFPSHFDSVSKDLLRNLLNSDLTKRLGNLRGGSEDVRFHPWFHGVNWRAFLERKIRAPIVPELEHSGDSKNFERYPEIDIQNEIKVTGNSDEFGEVFNEF